MNEDLRFLSEDPEALSQHQGDAKAGTHKCRATPLDSPPKMAVMLWAGQTTRLPEPLLFTKQRPPVCALPQGPHPSPASKSLVGCLKKKGSLRPGFTLRVETSPGGRKGSVVEVDRQAHRRSLCQPRDDHPSAVSGSSSTSCTIT